MSDHKLCQCLKFLYNLIHPLVEVITMNLAQNVCLDDLIHPLVEVITMNLDQNVCLDYI